MALLATAPAGCRGQVKDTDGSRDTNGVPAAGGQARTGSLSADDIAEARNLSPHDVAAALKTYQPSGRFDEYVMFSSTGHGGQLLVIGVPSMRLLKLIGVFAPEPWQGWGYGASGSVEIMRGGQARRDKPLSWADTHHPSLSETAGEYDGEFVFINDKANARMAVIDLRDFETKQIVKNPIADIDHGGTFVTPDTEWVVEGGQYAAPLGREYAQLEDYADKYRGHLTFWRFDRAAGRLDPEASFALELPPYWQDLCDAGKLASDGWAFCNSFNTEMATGKSGKDQVDFESGVSQNDMDFLHVINVDGAAELASRGGLKEVNGFKVISLETAIAERLLFFIPEPKSPHGVDVTPRGDYLVVGGKLDPHVSVYSWEKIQAAIAAGDWDTDSFGVPILPFDDVLEVQVELGLGPLHTQFDDRGYAYTSLFLDSAVARWSLGGEYRQDGAEPWKLVTKTPVHYNVGHIAAAEGDTVSPDGKYLVALNKWSIDRFQGVGPLRPQNLQLIDISSNETDMPVLYDMPLGIGEPHYSQIIKADKLKAWDVYPEIGWNPATMSRAPEAPVLGEERIERNGNEVTIWMTAVRSHFTPDRVELKKGDRVTWHITNVETAVDATHGLAVPVYNINLSLEPGETETLTFTADTAGVFPYYCTEFCSALHLEMVGYLLVEP
jgi:nitrous-oxide reductase